jgi:hypothetical protein
MAKLADFIWKNADLLRGVSANLTAREVLLEAVSG